MPIDFLNSDRYKVSPRLGAGVAFLTAVCTLLLFTPVSAQAFQRHQFSTSFAAPGSGDGQLAVVPHTPPTKPLSNEEPFATSGSGLAVNDASGDLYVADTGNHRIEEFSAAGTFIRAFGADVGGSGVDICTSGCQAGTSGSAAGQLEEPKFIAVDNTCALHEPPLSGPACAQLDPSAGDVYVGEENDGIVTKFDESGNLVEGWGNSGPGGSPNGQMVVKDRGEAVGPISGIAANNVGDLFVAEIDRGNGLEFDPNGSLIDGFDLVATPNKAGLAVDASNDLFVGASSGAGSGVRLRGIHIDEPGTAEGLAIDFSTDALYVDNGNYVSQFKLPVEELSPPSESFGPPQLTAGAGIAVNAVTHTVYVVDTTDDKVDVFPEVTVPDAETGEATEVTNTGAKLNGVINPDETEASYQFEYGSSTSYGEDSPASPAPVGNDDAGHPESAEISGLQPSTTYHFRIDGINSNGTNDGPDATFHTHGPPNVGEVSASDVSGVGAMIHGNVNPSGFTTTYRVEYGLTESYGSETSPVELAAADEAEAVAAELSGLSPETTYHFRLIAENSQGGTEGVDGEFTTEPPLQLGIQSVSSITGVCATLEAQVNPDGTDTSVQFEYGLTNGYGSVTAPIDAGSGNTLETVSAEVCGLAPLSTYHYRAVAENSLGTVDGADSTFETEPPVRVSGESVIHTTSHCTTLRAEINPFGASGTTVHFGYGTTAAYGSESASTSVPAADEPEPVGIEVCGLTPFTEYHYRAFAANAGGEGEGEDATFTTYPVPGVTSGCSNEALRVGPSSLLPDCRAYEMLTPPQNNDAEVFTPHANSSIMAPPGTIGYQSSLPFQIAADGDAVAYPGEGTVGGIGMKAGAGGNGGEYFASRGNGGWTQANIQPNGNKDDLYEAFSNQLSAGVLSADSNATYPPLGAGAPLGYATLYARTLPAGPYTPAFTTTPPNRSASQFGSYGIQTGYSKQSTPELTFAGASTDFSQLLFEANDALTEAAGNTPAAIDGGEQANNLYDSHDGQLSLVNVLPNGSTQPGASFGAPSGKKPDFSNDVSADGSRIFWTDEASGNLYVRENPTREQSPLDGEGHCEVPADACTVLVAAKARYWTATPDGSEVFYTKAGRLDSYRLTSEETSPLTAASSGVSAVIGSSADGSYVYFAATQVLASNENSEGVKATPGATNVYLLHGEEGPRFIATLSQHDETKAIDPYPNNEELFGDLQPSLGSRTAEVTPDGHNLLFVSNDQTGPGYREEVATNEQPVSLQEVYLFEAESGALHCVSCNPAGVAPEATSQAGLEGLGGFVPPSWQDTYQPRWISPDGSKVFFDSSEPLVPADTDGVQDAYEWERDGAGACDQAKGCVYLLGSGAGTSGSSLIGASASGDDVFFTSRAQLTAEDGNEDFNLFDARVGGGFPPPPFCEGESCLGRAAAPPPFSTPGSATFHGSAEGGTHPEKPGTSCKKGRVERHGRCVKKSSGHHKSKKRHGKRNARDNRRAGR